MQTNEVIGSVGVTILLIAFFLNIFKVLNQNSRIYISMNLIGAGIACYASVLINFIPFVILEATWSVVALAALIKSFIKPAL